MRLHLRIQGAGTTQSVTLDGSRSVVVGRSTEADLTLPDQRISRKHFRFDFGPNEVRLVEVDARNGTFVDGQRIDRPLVLRDGMEIVAGETTIKVRLEAAVSTAIVPPPQPRPRPNDETIVGDPPGATRPARVPAPPSRAHVTPPLPGEGTGEAPIARPPRDPRPSPSPDRAPRPPEPIAGEGSQARWWGAKAAPGPARDERGLPPPPPPPAGTFDESADLASFADVRAQRQPPPPPPPAAGFGAPPPRREPAPFPPPFPPPPAKSFDSADEHYSIPAPRTPPPLPPPPPPEPEPATPPKPRGPVAPPGYALDRLLHRAEFGPVQISIYLAIREESGTEVALKLLEGATPGSGQLAVFERGARIWATLRSARIVALLEDGAQRDPPYVAMEYAPRGSLEQVVTSLNGQLLMQEEALRVFLHIAQALETLEHQRIVHRAVQPSNILVAADGSYKLSDFFLAKEVTPNEPGLTRAGRVKGGSPYFMSPEQLRGGYVDTRTDIYALAAVFYHLLVGQPPHAALVEANAARLGFLGVAIQSAPPPPLPDMSMLPPGLERVLLRALEADSDRRYPSATAMLQDLAAIGAY